jgi:hypothetical protein
MSKTAKSCQSLLESDLYERQIRFLSDTFSNATEDDYNFEIKCFTELKVVNKGESTIYRGHPSFRGEDPWHDWVVVKWIGQDKRITRVPAEIQFFVNITDEIFPDADNIQGYKGDGTYAVIHSMEKETIPHNDSLLLSRGVREKDNNETPVYHLQRVDSFVRPAFVVDNIGCPRQSLLVLTPRSEWSKLFL